jgi:PEP-CTERM motif
MKKLLAITSLTLALGASGLFGAQITDPSIPSGAITAPGTFDFAAFDPSLGTLTGITLNLATSATGSATIANLTGGPLNYTSVTVNVPFVLTFTGGLGTYDFSASVVDNTPGTLTSPSSITVNGLTGTGNATESISPFTGYIGGPGTFTPTFSLSSGGTATVNGLGDQGLLYGGSATGSVVASITYTYTVPSTTPEPATMTLFGSAILGLGFFGRKRLKK